MHPTNTHRLTTLSLLTVLSLALYYVESLLPTLVPIPGVKLGLANLATLVVLVRYRGRDAFLVLLVRILLSSLLFGQAMSLLYSLTGGMLCLLAMIGLIRFLHVTKDAHHSLLFLISIGGALAHNIGQVLVAYLITSVPGVALYLPFLGISAILTGLFIGIGAQFTLRYLPANPPEAQ